MRKFAGVGCPDYFQASTIAPKTMSPAPIPSRRSNFSPRNVIASAKATTTLNFRPGRPWKSRRAGVPENNRARKGRSLGLIERGKSMSSYRWTRIRPLLVVTSAMIQLKRRIMASPLSSWSINRLRQFMGVRITRRDDAKSPGSDGASPTFRTSSIVFVLVLFIDLYSRRPNRAGWRAGK
jgi:hypothetical protein